MKKALVIGGNQFFGKHLVRELLNTKYEVTLLNRGNKDDGFGDQAKRIICDRNKNDQMIKAVGGKSWDCIFDQVCFDYDTAESACKIFEGRAGKYIFTSTVSVYGPGAGIKESDFDPRNHRVEKKETMNSDYGEAKRQAEVAFCEHAKFPTVMMRIPVVVGTDDVTKRLLFHVERIKNKKPIYFPNIEARKSFIHSESAGIALKFLAENSFEGPINVCSSQPIVLRDLVAKIESHVGEKMIPTEKNDEEHHSPYGISQDWFIDSQKLIDLGGRIPEIEEWLSGVILELSRNVNTP